MKFQINRTNCKLSSTKALVHQFRNEEPLTVSSCHGVGRDHRGVGRDRRGGHMNRLERVRTVKLSTQMPPEWSRTLKKKRMTQLMSSRRVWSQREQT